jgi:hypothetical protein
MLALLTLTALACDPSDPCDSGDYEEHGACYPIRQEQPESDAGPVEDAGDAASDAADEPPSYEGFGEECTEAADCPNDLICGAPMLPVCTQVNCLDEPSICPPDWTCFDTTGLSPDPNVTSICLEL